MTIGVRVRPNTTGEGTQIRLVTKGSWNIDIMLSSASSSPKAKSRRIFAKLSKQKTTTNTKIKRASFLDISLLDNVVNSSIKCIHQMHPLVNCIMLWLVLLVWNKIGIKYSHACPIVQ